MKKLAQGAFVLAVQVGLIGPAWSKPEYLQYWQTRYPDSTLPERIGRATGNSCNLCHPKSGFEWDRPGTAYREMLHAFMHSGKPTIQAAIEAADLLDADSDGVPNGVEILTARPDGEVGYHPGLVGQRGIDPTSATGSEVLTGAPETPPFQQALVFDTPVLQIGNLALNQVVSLPLLLRNTSTTRQSVARLDFALQNTSGFSFRSPYPAPFFLEPGHEITLTVDCVGVAPGYFYRSLGWLQVVSGAPGVSPTTALLSARGGFGAISLSATALHFDVVEAGASARRSVLLTNMSDIPLQLRDPKIQGPGAAAFNLEWTGGPAWRLEPRSTATLNLNFTPLTELRVRASLRISTDAPAQSEVSIALDGEGRWRVTPGDTSRDGKFDLTDAVTILKTLFAGAETTCPDSLDANDNGQLSVTDAIYLLRFLFLGDEGPKLCPLDASPAYLGCPEGSACNG